MADILVFPKSYPTIEELIEFLTLLKDDKIPLRGAAVVFELQNGRVAITIANLSAGSMAFGALLLQEEALLTGEVAEEDNGNGSR